MSTKIELIHESNSKLDYYNKQMKEKWDKLKPYDQERLIKNGIIKKDDIKKS